MKTREVKGKRAKSAKPPIRTLKMRESEANKVKGGDATEVKVSKVEFPTLKMTP